MPVFKNKNGSLTNYALSCGYIEKVERGFLKVEMYKDAGCNIYHVRKFENNTRVFWLTYDNLTDARKVYNKCIKLTFKNFSILMSLSL